MDPIRPIGPPDHEVTPTWRVVRENPDPDENERRERRREERARRREDRSTPAPRRRPKDGEYGDDGEDGDGKRIDVRA